MTMNIPDRARELGLGLVEHRGSYRLYRLHGDKAVVYETTDFFALKNWMKSYAEGLSFGKTRTQD